MYCLHFIYYLEFMTLTVSARGHLNFPRALIKLVCMEVSKEISKHALYPSIHPSIISHGLRYWRCSFNHLRGIYKAFFQQFPFLVSEIQYAWKRMSSYVARSSLVLLCKYTEQPDNYSPSLEGTETFQDIDHLRCPASRKSISCAHAGSGWMRHGDSARRSTII